MTVRKGFVLLILLCVLAGCSPKDTSLRAYCTESQQEFLDQSLEELPVALTYHHNDNILGRYETTDEEIISEILQALRETTIVSKAFSGSTDSRILEFETADGDTCLFWFDENRFHGAGGSGAENSGNISGIQGSDGVKRQIEKAGCSLLVCS
mgnify:CR=1 FL=1